MTDAELVQRYRSISDLNELSTWSISLTDDERYRLLFILVREYEYYTPTEPSYA